MKYIKKYSVEIVLIALIIFFSIQRPANFPTIGNALTILKQCAILGIVSIGMTFVLIPGGINLAVGAMISIVNVMSAILMTTYGVNWGLAFAISVFASTITGLITGTVIVKTKIWPMIGTLALQEILFGISYIICKGMPVTNLPKDCLIFGQGKIFEIPVSVVIFLVLAIVAAFILNSTYLGRYFYAIGSNREAARLSGIPVDRICIFSYVISGFLCGIAGVIMTGRVSSGQPTSGSGYDMNSLTAVVLGGVSLAGGSGKISKAMCGVIILGVLINGMTLLDISEYTQMIIEGAILLVAVCFDQLSANKRQ